MPTIVIPHPARGRVEHPLTTEEITIGRMSENTIQIRDDSVSGRHARLTRRDGHYHLQDLGSTNRCYVNDREVEDIDLTTPCSIRFGNVVCDFRIEDPVGDPIAAQFSSFQKQIQTILGDRDGARSKQTEAEAARDEALGKAATLKEQYEGASKQTAELLEKLAASEKRTESMTRELRNLRESSEQAARQIEDQRREIKAVTEQRDAAKQLGQQARLKLGETTQELTSAKSALESATKEAADLKSRVGFQASQIESLTTQRDELQRSNDQINARLAESRQRVDSMTRLHEKASKELAEARAELAGLLEGAETVISWFERISKRSPSVAQTGDSAAAPENPIKPLPSRVVKPIRTEGSAAAQGEVDERSVTRKIELPGTETLPPRPSSATATLPARPAGLGQTQRIELPIPIATATARDSVPPLLENMTALLGDFRSNRADLSPFHDILRDAYNLTRTTAKIGSSPLFNLASALEALIRDLQHMPARITDGSLGTVTGAIDLLRSMVRDEHFSRTKDLRDDRIFAIGRNAEIRQAVVAALNAVNLKTKWIDDPESSLPRIASQPVDLLLLDDGSRGTNGQDPCAILRRMPAHAKTPILLLAGTVPAADGGVSDSILKPFSHRELAVKALTWLFKGQLGLA